VADSLNCSTQDVNTSLRINDRLLRTLIVFQVRLSLRGSSFTEPGIVVAYPVTLHFAYCFFFLVSNPPRCWIWGGGGTTWAIRYTERIWDSFGCCARAADGRPLRLGCVSFVREWLCFWCDDHGWGLAWMHACRREAGDVNLVGRLWLVESDVCTCKDSLCMRGYRCP
jgi:hypothetical protein